ncbi:MAG: response regulator [Chitinispirillales bacterium]|jgi:signal transduction histidine kinase/CheY-like chemotaxis protein|nr:response regulator [Chitinispirillales bacterium]
MNDTEQRYNLLDAYERAKLLLNTTPLACRLWNSEFKIFDCNDENVKLFNMRDRHEYMERYFELSPKYQPDGLLSYNKTLETLEKVFAEGRYVFEWMHQLLDGTPLPVEITLVRVKYGDDDVIAGYTRDLREQKQMMQERHELMLSAGAAAAKLKAVVKNYPGIIFSMDQNYKITLLDGIYHPQLFDSSLIFENQGAQTVIQKSEYTDLQEKVRKTFTEGSQDFYFEIGERTFRLRTSQIAEGGGNVGGIMGSIDDVTERVQLQKELRTALLEAEKANDAKNRFLANMSHEMRTPLNAVIGLSELSLESQELNDEVYSSLEKINNAGTTLLSLVNDILDISKIKAGKFEIVPAEYDTASLINDIVTQNILHIGEKPIQFVLNIDENLPSQLYGDELRIKQICNNLLSNAFKYTEKGKVEFEIRCERKGGAVWMTAYVRDTGIGIFPGNIDRIFDDYTQIDKKTNYKIMGTGLGLPITKSLIDIMGGSINVESDYGNGSVFTVRVPQKYVNDVVIGPEVVNNLKSLRYSDLRRKQNLGQPRISLPYARVLLVDDVATNLDIAKGMMKRYGMQIDCVSGGRQAIDAIRNEDVRYNAVFMDHMMPEMDGIEAVRRIREEIGTEYAKTVPIIALTANAIVGNESMFLNKGFQAFIPKPIEIKRLDSVIRQWVQNKPARNEIPAVNSKISVPNQSRVKIDGVDVDKGIEGFGGDEQVYFDVLRSFSSNTPALLEKIKTVTKEGLPYYATIAHGIKGASRGICAQTVGDKANIMEKAAKAGDYDFVIANNDSFLETICKLLSQINDALPHTNANSPKPEQKKPDRKILDRLLDACDNYDMDGIDAAAAELDSYKYESGGELAAWIIEKVNQSAYGQIARKLSELNDKPETRL